MVTLNDSLVSSSARRLTIRVRPDISARKQYYLGQSYWVVKEPVGLNYFRFQEEEYAILKMIDGATSLDEIKERFEAEFPPQKITLEELQQFVGMLHKSGLVIADVPGQGKQLKQRRDEKRRKEIMGAMSNILCIRFKGFDPERFLTRIYPYFKWIYSPITLFFCLPAGRLGRDAGGGPVRRLPVETPRFLPVLLADKRAVSGGDAGGGEGVPRIRPWVDV